ncbi:hypothetical protein [Myceligenerans crystallogenes]|uniref:hypothetical protein n=1 Tax=Myceligenerans crystallogenes TaxID=316335 RepID=UPI0031D99E79
MTTDSFVAAGLERYLRSRGREGLEEFLVNNPLMHLKMHQSYGDLVLDALQPATVEFGIRRLSTPHVQVLAALLRLNPYATRAAVVEHLAELTDAPAEQVEDKVVESLNDLIGYAYAWPLDVAQARSDPDDALLAVNPGLDIAMFARVDTSRFDVEPPEFTEPAGSPVDDDAAALALAAVTDAALSVCRRLDLRPFPTRDTSPDLREQDELCREAGVDPRMGELVTGVLQLYGEIVSEETPIGCLLKANPAGLWLRVSRASFAKHLGSQWFRGFDVPELPLNAIVDDVPDGLRIRSAGALQRYLEWAHPFDAYWEDADGDGAHHPEGPRRPGDVGHGPTAAARYLEIATAVGMMRDGALTTYGRAMVRDRGLAGVAVSSMLGGDSAPLLLGDDLTATAIAELPAELVRVLDLAAERRPGEETPVWVFSEDSLVRAAELDLPPLEVRRALEQTVQDEVPTPLDELISAVHNGVPADDEPETLMWEYQISRILAS